MAKKKGKGRVGLVIVIVIAVAALGLVAARQLKNRSAKNDTRYTVHGETYQNVIDIAGTISAAHEQKLQAAGNGSVIAVYVKAGDRVKEGDVILQLDDSEQQYNLLRHDYDMEQKRITGAARELALLRQQREVLIQRIKDRKVIANFDGVIASFTVAEGDVFEAKDEVGVIVDRSYLRAEVEVVETDAPKLKTGQKVTLKFPAYTERSIEGYVESFPAVGTVTSRGATVVKAEIRVENPPEEILPNFSFTGQIEITPPQDVLLVERQAIGYQEGKAFVERIAANGDVERIDVRVRPYGQNFVSVISGLQEGDVVKAQQQTPVSGQGGRPGGNRPGGNMPRMPR